MQEKLFRLISCKLQSLQLSSLRLYSSPQLQQEARSNGMEEMIPLQFRGERFHFGQGHLCSCHIPQCHSSVQLDNWRGRHLQQQIIEREDLPPIGCLPGGGFGMASDQCCLQLVRTWTT